MIDTETVTGTYGLLSVGAVILKREDKKITEFETYFGFSSEFEYGFYFAQQYAYAQKNGIKRKTRFKIEAELAELVRRYDINTAFAYNAGFDKAVIGAYLPSLKFSWFDLMKPARKILADENHYPVYKNLYPDAALTRGGLLKRGYSVDCVGRYLGLPRETHIAVEDAQMETEIALKLGLFDYASPV